MSEDEPKAEWKWRGTPLSELTDEDLLRAERTTLAIAGAIERELWRRGILTPRRRGSRAT